MVDGVPPPLCTVVETSMMLNAGKKLLTNEGVIAKAKVYLEIKHKLFYKSDIEMLGPLWNEIVALDEYYIDE